MKKKKIDEREKKKNEKSLINLIISLTKRKMMFLYQFIVIRTVTRMKNELENFTREWWWWNLMKFIFLIE